MKRAWSCLTAIACAPWRAFAAAVERWALRRRFTIRPGDVRLVGIRCAGQLAPGVYSVIYQMEWGRKP